jgi:hypothetical protein
VKNILMLSALLFCASFGFGQAQGIPGVVMSSNGAPTGNCLSTAYNILDFTVGNWWYCPVSGAPPVLAGGTTLARISQKPETGAADAALLSYTPPAATVGTYDVCTVASVSSATSGVVGFTVSWTDSNGNAQSNIAMALTQLGTAAPALTFTTSAASNYSMCQEIDINNAAAAIVVKWVGGGTTAAKVSATISRLS